jgi:GDP/UDP-N,N'-diacetylbacillosamine 2-epimerase (hydrolysing)
MTLRKIIYVTGTRADYGLMREILKKLHLAADIDLAICVTGMHISKLYGNTISEIQADGFKICETVLIDVDHTTQLNMAKNIGHQVIAMTEILASEQPDILLLLGDRGEMLAAAIAAVHLNIPIVHIHGGERSGTVDEMVRHAISKLSHYHFVATEASRIRLIKMGENPDAIFIVGAPGLEEIKNHQPISKQDFYKKYKLNKNQNTAILLYHPVVQEYNEIELQIKNLLDATLQSGLQLICLEPNSDAGGQLIRSVLQQYCQRKEIIILSHLKRKDFIDCLANVDIMLGNSSSGIIEAASLNLLAINIGTRQRLRECGDNVIHSDVHNQDIQNAIATALKRPKRFYNNIYGDGNTSERCLKLLQTINLNSQILNKSNEY